MKPNQDKSRKLNLNKQSIQKLDNKKLVNMYAGERPQAVEAGTTTVALSAVYPEESGYCVITIAQ